MPADRLLKKSRSTPELDAERKRVGACITTLIDRTLELHDTCPDDQRFVVGLFAADLAHLAGVVRDGGDAADLEQQLSRRAVVR